MSPRSFGIEGITDEDRAYRGSRFSEVCEALFANPHHPYTRALLDSVPSTDPKLRGRLKPVTGEVPSALNPPPGCAFAPRCARASEECRAAPRVVGTTRPDAQKAWNPVQSPNPLTARRRASAPTRADSDFVQN